jgi:hypothetical protein
VKQPRLGFFAGCIFFAVSLFAGGAEAAEPEGYQLYEATAATVNGEVIFLSDLDREACLKACGAFPGDEAVGVSLSEARDGMIADILVRQQEEKLGLGTVDNAVLQETAARAMDITGACSIPCAREISDGQVREYAARKLLVREFLRNRVSVFVDVNEEEVEREIERRASRTGKSPGEIPKDAVRKELLDEKAAREIRNWFDRATSKSRILVSPLEERWTGKSTP